MNKNLVSYKSTNKELILLVFIATILGFYKLGELPLPVNQDELSNIYDAYALSETGADRFGHKYPIVLEAFGKSDYRPSLYAWLTVIPIKIFGLSIESGRSISVICFVLSLIFLYLTAIKIYDKQYTFLVCIVFIFSPWSWSFSRLSHEGTMLPSLFVIMSLYLFIRIYKQEKHNSINFILLGFIIGFSTNAYQSSRLIALLTAILVFVFFYTEKINQKNKKIFLLTLFCVIGAIPQIYIYIFHPTFFYGRYDSVKINSPDFLQHCYTIINNIYTNLSPSFLFLNFGKENSLTISRFPEVELIFFYVGLFTLFKQHKGLNKNLTLFIILNLIITIIPCALTINNPDATRLSAMLIICPIFIGSGIYFFIQKIQNNTIRNTAYISIILVIIISFNVQYNKYKHSFALLSNEQQNNLVQLANKLNTIYKNYDTILFENSGNQPYIYFLYYCHIHPSKFQLMEKIYDNGEFYTFKKTGNIYFLPYDDIIKKDENNNSNNLIISHSYPQIKTIIDSIITPKRIYYFSKKN